MAKNHAPLGRIFDLAKDDVSGTFRRGRLVLGAFLGPFLVDFLWGWPPQRRPTFWGPFYFGWLNCHAKSYGMRFPAYSLTMRKINKSKFRFLAGRPMCRSIDFWQLISRKWGWAPPGRRRGHFDRFFEFFQKLEGERAKSEILHRVSRKWGWNVGSVWGSSFRRKTCTRSGLGPIWGSPGQVLGCNGQIGLFWGLVAPTRLACYQSDKFLSF